MGYRLVHTVFYRQKIFNDDTRLHFAIKNFNGNLRTLRLLVKREAGDINVRNLDGQTPLHLAVQSRRCSLGLVHLLWKHGADFNVADIHGNTPLHYVVQNAALRCCSHCRHTHNRCAEVVIRFLLKRSSGSDFNVGNLEGDTPLHLAARCDATFHALLTTLLAHGGDPNARNLKGDTVLHSYLRNNKQISWSCLVTFLENARDVNAGNCRGETPLHLALRNEAACKVVYVKTLLAFGADPKRKDEMGEDAYQVYRRTLSEGDLREDPMLRILLQSSEQQHMETSLHVACLFHNVDAVKKLLNTVDDVNAVDHFGNPPLFYALIGFTDKFGVSKCLTVKQMLDYGADLNQEFAYSQAPIQFKAGNHHQTYLMDLAYMMNQQEQCRGIMWNMAYQHAIKLAALEKKRSERGIVEPYLHYYIEFYEEWLPRYTRELDAMDETMIGDSRMSFLDLLLASATKTETFVKNKTLVKEFQENRARFPIYQGMLKAKIAREIERQELIEWAAEVFSTALKFAHPSDEFYEITLGYCSNKDLLSVIAIDECE